MATTSKWPVRPYRSITSRTDRRPSLQRVWTWKSHSRNGSYPGMMLLGPYVEMFAVGGPVPQDLGPEVAHVQAEHFSFPHHDVAARRCPHPAIAAHRDAADSRQP